MGSDLPLKKISRVDLIIASLLSAFKVEAKDFCDIETVQGPYNLVMNTGALASLIRYDGIRSIIAEDSLNNQIARLADSLKISLKQANSHQLCMIFRRDLDASYSTLYDVQQQQLRTAEALKLDVADLIIENTETYGKYVYDEECYLALITHPKVRDEVEVKQDFNRLKKQMLEKGDATFAHAQNPFIAPLSLVGIHDAFIKSFLNQFEHPEFPAVASLVNVEDALKISRRMLNPLTSTRSFKPILPATDDVFKRDHATIRWDSEGLDQDFSSFMPMPLPEQIIINEMVITIPKQIDAPPNCVRTGGMMYAPVFIKVPPSKPVRFVELFDKLNRMSTMDDDGVEHNLPYTMSFMLTADGLSSIKFKALMSSFLGIGSQNNKNIRLAASELRDRQHTYNDTIVGLQISALTWAEDQPKYHSTLSDRRQKLIRAIEEWGSCQTFERAGNPIYGLVSQIPNLTLKSHAPKIAVPIIEALSMLPWVRPASPFATGTALNRTRCGKLITLQMFSDRQSTWVNLYCGKPGSGKSVAMNNDVIEAILMPGLKRLPFIFMTDIGISSQGPITLIQEALPEHLKHLAVYQRLKSDVSSAINPFDISIGQRYPLPNEFEQVVSFITSLVTPPERAGKAHEGMRGFVGEVVKMLYEKSMDGHASGNPRKYAPHQNEEIDQAIKEHFPIHAGSTGESITYYELEDKFHFKGDYRARDLCHRMAMPVLADVASIINDESIRTRYGESQTDAGPMIGVFTTGLLEAISQYPGFSSTTRFDVDTARIVALDLQDVVSKDNPKQASLYFQIARMVAKRRIAYSIEDLPLISRPYRPYYEKLIGELSEDPKIMTYDELHNARADEQLFMQFEKDAREARKWRMMLMFASQNIDTDFGALLKAATRIVIADRGNKQTQDWIQNQIGLTNVQKNVLAQSVGRDANGLNYLSYIVADQANYIDLLTLTIGPKRIWALTTDPDERALRTYLYSKANRTDALNILAFFFPSGASKKIKEQRAKVMSQISIHGGDSDELLGSVINQMGDEMLARYSDNRISL